MSVLSVICLAGTRKSENCSGAELNKQEGFNTVGDKRTCLESEFGTMAENRHPFQCGSPESNQQKSSSGLPLNENVA